MLNFCDFIQVYVFTTNHHLKVFNFSPICVLVSHGINDLRIIICSRNSEVFVERISVCNVDETLEEHGIHSCHAPEPTASYICYHSNYEFILMSMQRHQDVILPSTTAGNSKVGNRSMVSSHFLFERSMA